MEPSLALPAGGGSVWPSGPPPPQELHPRVLWGPELSQAGPWTGELMWGEASGSEINNDNTQVRSRVGQREAPTEPGL